MPEIKLTKNELRLQQNRMHQLEKYLPTLQLKKGLLQLEVNQARAEMVACEMEWAQMRKTVDRYAPLLVENLSIDICDSAKILKVDKRFENIAGVEVPCFAGIVFADFTYDLFTTPTWVDRVVHDLKALVEAEVKMAIAREKKAVLEKELREVSIRVNLFEKILIPRAQANIKKIKIFLGDQQLAAVSQAKVAKNMF